MNRKVFFIIIILVLTTQIIFANEKTERTITVVGKGKVSAAPDIVSLNLGVNSINEDLEAAISDNNRRINKIISVIKKYGIEEKNYSTSNFSVHYNQPYKENNGTYNVNNNIYIEIEKIENIGTFIQDTLKAGANQFYGLEYSIKNTIPLKKKARKLAIKNAIEIAEETAEAAGVCLGDILSIQENPYTGIRSYSSKLEASGSNSVTTIPGEKIIETEITMVFKIK